MRKAIKLNIDGTTETLDLDVESTLGVLQEAVDGYIDLIQLNPSLNMYINDEGKFTQEPNPYATHMFRAVYNTPDFISGPVVFVGGVDSEGNDTELARPFVQIIEGLKESVRVW